MKSTAMCQDKEQFSQLHFIIAFEPVMVRSFTIE